MAAAIDDALLRLAVLRRAARSIKSSPDVTGSERLLWAAIFGGIQLRQRGGPYDADESEALMVADLAARGWLDGAHPGWELEEERNVH